MTSFKATNKWLCLALLLSLNGALAMEQQKATPGVEYDERRAQLAAPAPSQVGQQAGSGGGGGRQVFRRQASQTALGQLPDILGTNTPLSQLLPQQQEQQSVTGGVAKFFQDLGKQFERPKRQVSYPQLPTAESAGQPPQQQPAGESGSGGVFKFLQDLGPQMERAKAITSLFNAVGGGSGGQQQQQPSNGLLQSLSQPANSNQQQFNPMQLFSQFSELIRSTQDRNARMLETTQRSADNVGQQTASAARQAQGGIQAALAEMGAGLQRLAANNPNLLPELKNLYQSVSTKLSSASSSVNQAIAPPKNGPEQFAEQLAKAGQQ